MQERKPSKMEPFTQATSPNMQANIPAPAITHALSFIQADGTSLTEVAHEARNMVAALGVYCDLLEGPGVLAPQYQHYGSELKMVAAASRRLVDRLAALDHQGPSIATDGTLLAGDGVIPGALSLAAVTKPRVVKYLQQLPSTLIKDLGWDLRANSNLLSALAGPAINVTVDTPEDALPVRLTSEDFTRILVNLIKNAAEAMPQGGHIHLTMRACSSDTGEDGSVILNVEDNGPGIPQSALDKIFEAGFTTRIESGQTAPAMRRGLGLPITRSLVEAAGGHIHAANRDPLGACFQIELPLRTV
ncbi:MAG: ATP-binding protein [Terracidiphilus sp.]